MTKDDTEKKNSSVCSLFYNGSLSTQWEKKWNYKFHFFVSSFFPSKTKLQQFFLSFNAFEEPMLCAKKTDPIMWPIKWEMSRPTQTLYRISLFCSRFSHTFHGYINNDNETNQFYIILRKTNIWQKMALVGPFSLNNLQIASLN